MSDEPKGHPLGIYCLQVSSSCFIDSALFRGVGAVANAPPKGVRANVRFVAFAPTKSARIEVVRHINAGDEIFAGYGAEYWRHAGAPHSTVDVPDWEWDLSDPFAAPLPPVPAPLAPVVVPVAPVVSSPAMSPAVPVAVVSVPDFVPFPPLPAGQASSCLSPGPPYVGSPQSQLWDPVLSSLPDWPISDAWRDFAFEPLPLPLTLRNYTCEDEH